MATHSSVFARRIDGKRKLATGFWRATVHEVEEELDETWRLNDISLADSCRIWGSYFNNLNLASHKQKKIHIL